MQGRVSVLAPAKVNLWLAILAKRSDGYHELETGMAALELADRLTLSATDSGRIELQVIGNQATADIPGDDQNLASRALAQVLAWGRERGLLSKSAGVHCLLEKHIPSQAGLGGGSADAAAAFLGCQRLFLLNVGRSEQERLLSQLGSDCVFFAATAATGYGRCSGRGERVEELAPPAPRWWVALLTPSATLATAAVYRALAAPLSKASRSPTVPIAAFAGSLSEARRRLFNDLEQAASQVMPDWGRWRTALDSAGAAHYRLAGSGSSFFGLYAEEEEAREGLARVLASLAAAGLSVRGRWVTRLAGRGVQWNDNL